MTKRYPTKRNIFILLSILCLLLIIFIQLSIPQKATKHQQFTIEFDRNKLISSPYLLLIGLLVAGYSITIFLGFFNLINFIIRNFKKPLFSFEKQTGAPRVRRRLPVGLCNTPRGATSRSLIIHGLPKACPWYSDNGNKSLPLSQEDSSKLIFFILFLVFLIYFLQWLTIIFRLKIDPISTIIFFNFIVEIAVVLLTVKYLKAGYLDFKLNINRVVDTAKKYLTILPVLIGIIFINNFVLAKLGIETTINPVIELFLKIKSVLLFSFLMFQIVFLGPLAEELFFRGFIYKLLRKKYGFLLSAASSSLLFAALHRSSQDAFPLAVLAIILCYVYEKTNNIASPILFHIIHNSLNVSFLLLVKILT